jgi:hypothetical protein
MPALHFDAPAQPPACTVRGLRRIPLSIIAVVCWDWNGEIHCWRHSRRYRALCRDNDWDSVWEVIYVRDGTRRCHMAH